MRRNYPCIEVNLDKITHNANTLRKICEEKDIDVVGVSKVFCSDKTIVEAMLKGGVKAIGDSRIQNLRKLSSLPCEKVLLRIPMRSDVGAVVRYADISLNSELETIKKLSKAAVNAKKTHKVILMVDLGDLREGVLEYDVLDLAREIVKLPQIELLGVGTNLTCYGGVIPDESNLGKLIAIKEKIEKILEIKLSVVSGGNSSSIHMVLDNTIPKGVTQLRLGESMLLGNETAYQQAIDNIYRDAFILKGEIVEVKNKPSVPIGKIGLDAFGEVPKFQDKGIIKRAIIALGRQDIKMDGMIPVDSKINIIGASSDHLILDVTEGSKEYKLGDVIEFYMDYGCLLQAMTSNYVYKYYIDDDMINRCKEKEIEGVIDCK